MKTLEEIKKRIESNTYQESDIYYIMGYLTARGVDIDMVEFDSPESSDNSIDFVRWFESEEGNLNKISKATVDKLNDAYMTLVEEINVKFPNLKLSIKDFIRL